MILYNIIVALLNYLFIHLFIYLFYLFIYLLLFEMAFICFLQIYFAYLSKNMRMHFVSNSLFSSL